MNRSPARALWCVAALGTLGCGEGERAALWVPSDSAGVEIVTNRSDGASWRLSQVPVLSLGVVDQGGPTEFYRVSDLELLEDGGLAVDDTDRLWARVYALPDEPDERWLVFEAGRLASSLVSPRGFSVMDVRGNRIAGVWSNDLGVEFVQVYEFR